MNNVYITNEMIEQASKSAEATIDLLHSMFPNGEYPPYLLSWVENREFLKEDAEVPTSLEEVEPTSLEEVIEGHMIFAVQSLNRVETDLGPNDYREYLRQLNSEITRRMEQ
ncbi:MAG: hypothetical protein KDI79_06125 [Anaerolineae bacterium]|nr:hypothetical protein [Anaerolineae bacterium]